MRQSGTKNMTTEQRKKIQQLLGIGLNKRSIAEQVGVSERTIYRELKKGRLNGNYDAEYSEMKTLQSNKNKGKSPKFEIDERLANYISNLILNNKLTIIQIKEKCKKEGISCPSRTTIYRSIDNGLIPNVTRESLQSNTTTMFSNGLLQIPKYMRKKLNLNDKDYFNIELDGEKIVISKIKDAKKG